MRVSIRLVPPESLPARTALAQLGQRIDASLTETAEFLRRFADSLERGVELWDDEEEMAPSAPKEPNNERLRSRSAE